MRTFSVVMIIRDDIKFIECALASINNCDYPRDQFEVIVVDDGSDTPIEKRINVETHYNLTILYLPRTEKSCRNRARNHGAKHAKNEFLIIVDGDQFHTEDFISNYDKYFSIKRNRLAVCGPRYHIHENSLVKTHRALLNGQTPTELVKDGQQDERIKALKLMGLNFSELECNWHFFWSCNFCVNREVYLKVGGFDEQLSGWGIDDIELGYRLFHEGYPFDFLENNPTIHFVGDFHINKTKYLGWLYNLQMFYQKYRDPRILQLIELEQPIIDYFYDGMPEKMSWFDALKRINGKFKLYNDLNPPKYKYNHDIGESIKE